MNKRAFHRSRGFTLIELMIVLVIMALVTPIIYRLYHEGVKKRYSYLRESSDTLRGTQALFRFLEQDLRHTDLLINSFGELKTGTNTLIIKVISPEERVRLLKRTGDLSKDMPDKKYDFIIIYRLNRLKREVIREVHQGRIIPASSAKSFSGESETIDIFYDKNEKSSLVFVSQSFSMTALLGDVDDLDFTLNHQRIEEATWVRLHISRSPRNRKTQSMDSIYRIFDIG